MVSMNSTLVETVSINYEDFNESFLTCGTCLCMYDGNEHTPKLLQCSHTVCLHCLTRIAASQTRDTGTFRCPICRELITIPRGGVSALPPSFLVNQLLDLMSRQRREVIPKCSVHINQELLFCETCDTVFCTVCMGGSHNNTANSCEHTIIPFSIAIKRMSEILLYKANECISKLSEAQDGVNRELERLDAAKESCLEKVNATFQHVQALVDKRKQEMMEAVENACTEKRKVLEEQHSLIECEKNKVEQECQGLQYQVEVRNITQRIQSLSEKLDAASSLGDPRENAFLTCDFTNNDSLKQIEQSLQELGKVRSSTTFPSLCTAHIEGDTIVGIECLCVLSTVDYHGDPRRNGGDPIQVDITQVNTDGSSSDPLPVNIVDCEDGMYKIYFRTHKPGRFRVNITVFERPIKDFPLYFDVSEHNNPVSVYGTRGSGKDEFMQPVAVAVDDADQAIYVLDTGNSRIKVLNRDMEFVKHITNEGLNGRSCTGIAVSNNGLVVVNWRTKAVTEMTTTGQTLKSFTYNAFQEPIDIAVDKSYGHILVADNGMSCVFVFDSDGKILFQVGKKGIFSLISSVTVGPSGEIVVADSRIQVFSAKGDFLEVLHDEGKEITEAMKTVSRITRGGIQVELKKPEMIMKYDKFIGGVDWADQFGSMYYFLRKGRYGGIILDSDSRILASRTEQKGRNYIQVLSLLDHNLNNIIDSHESKLKRPSGIAVTSDHHVIVVDLGNNCIKKYRYW